jgi:hypothetical protein
VIAMTERRMSPRLKIALGVIGFAVLACAVYGALHELCLVDARWLYR